jgi:glyoxylase I family protein
VSGSGVHHVDLVVSSVERSLPAHARLRERGAEIETPPREYDYSPGYYAVFFRDPDGMELEVVHAPDDV